MGNKKYLLAALVLLIPVFQKAMPPQRAQIEGFLSDLDRKAIRVAVPEFRSTSADPKAAQFTKVFNDVLWSDLENSGQLALPSRAFYPVGNFATASDIRAADWTAQPTAADYIAFGSTAMTGTNFSVDALLVDLKSETRLIGTRYFADSEESARAAAHAFADEILSRLGLGKGITRTQIAFVCQRSGQIKEICLMDYDGNNVRALTATGDLAIEPAFSPDGQKVAYVTWRSGHPNIEIITLSNGRRAPFEQPRGVTNHTPAWSPDSALLAYSSGLGADIVVADWNGKQARRITQTPSSDFSPTWNPKTGKQIAFVSNRTGTPQIFIMESDGTNVRRILDEGGDMENPAWSPDGFFIAFAWQKPKTGVYDIYLHQISSGRTVQLTKDSGKNERPTWAPDGKHLAFQSDRTGTTQIYSMLANGTQVRQLTTRGKNEGPTWSGYTP